MDTIRSTVNHAHIRPDWRRVTRNVDPICMGKDKVNEEKCDYYEYVGTLKSEENS